MHDLFSYSDEPATRDDRTGKRSIRSKQIMCKSALSNSRLPGLDYSLNPYEGCEHGCVYCYAPHVLRVSPSEWGKWVNAKVNMPSLLSKELKYKEGVVGVGTVTDPYQPAESSMSLTRKCLARLLKSKLHVSILTKSDLVLRDVPMLVGSSKVEVGVTVTIRDDNLAAVFEPFAPPPSRRLLALAEMNAEGIETYVLLGPLIPLATDRELDRLISDIAETGTRRIMVDRLRLRPGMLDKIHRMNMFRDDRVREQFDTMVLSPSYFNTLELKVRDLAENAGLTLESAF